MIIFYRANDLVAAEVMADELLAQDSLLPFPYLIKGFLADRGRDDARAIQLYEHFLQLAPNEPESPKIRERVAALRNPVPLPEE
jgi:regulator of sirC expression with transglutaminase-like and TPR domain